MSDRRAEDVVVALLLASAACATAFVVEYVLDADTQRLGLALGGALAFLAAASAVAGRRLVPQEKLAEPLGERAQPEAEAETTELVREAASGISRRKLLVFAVGGAVGALGAAVVVPAASLGPLLREREELLRTSWRAGLLLVDERGRPLELDELEVGSFTTAFAEGVERRRLDASLVVVRLRDDELELPPERAGWAPAGVLAFSKICTHAGCAISIFRYPSYEPTSARPALVCPCHYSAFDPRTGGEVLFGPAARPLPQLPLAVDDDGVLVARGGLSAPPGPSWWKVRRD